MAKRITVRPATQSRFSVNEEQTIVKKRVAAYARVSTGSEEQQTSYEAQVKYYSTLIQAKEEWIYVGVYSDEGISGTGTKRRKGFKKMVADAKAGKIDLILTKSLSRFARNTVDALVTIRELRDCGVGIFFEKENFDTLDAKGELLITLFSSLAQEESRSISENTAWGHHQRFKAGEVSVAYGTFLGYGKDFEIIPEQAEIVKKIYRLFLSGKSYHAIAKQLTEDGDKTPTGKGKWYQGTVRSILENEKYKGDAILQKFYTVDFLSKKQVPNNGKLPQYYIHENHLPIIEPRIWDVVQLEIRRRDQMKGSYSCKSIFSSRIQCGECGGWYGSKVWHSNDPYKKQIWQCNCKAKGEKCSTPFLTEDEVKRVFIEAVNKMIANKDEIIEAVEMVREQYMDTSKAEREAETLREDLNSVMELIREKDAENATYALNQEVFREEYAKLCSQRDKIDAKIQAKEEEIQDLVAKNKEMELFIGVLKDKDETVTEFDPVLWTAMIDHIRVYSKQNIRVVFKGDTTI